MKKEVTNYKNNLYIKFDEIKIKVKLKTQLRLDELPFGILPKKYF